MKENQLRMKRFVAISCQHGRKENQAGRLSTSRQRGALPMRKQHLRMKRLVTIKRWIAVIPKLATPIEAELLSTSHQRGALPIKKKKLSMKRLVTEKLRLQRGSSMLRAGSSFWEIMKG